MISHLFRRAFDFLFSVSLLGAAILLVVVSLNPSTGPHAAELWARTFALKTETSCPTSFGNAFWFECAAEVRRTGGTIATR